MYYRYQGSLTTPPCAESVTWTIYDYRIPILASTLEEFSLIKTEEEDESTHEKSKVHLVNNYRPLQPLNNRVIKINRIRSPFSSSQRNAADFNRQTSIWVSFIVIVFTIFLSLNDIICQ